MIKFGKRLLFACLILYSCLILFIEYTQGQSVVRNYVSDIEGKLPFYGVNTTLSTIFLVLTAYNFGLVFFKMDLKAKSQRRMALFVLTQIFVFLLLAFDDRFRLHESIRTYLDVSDSLLHVLIALLEMVVFIYCKQINWPLAKRDYYLITGGFLFVVMFMIDRYGSSTGFMRLSFEDITKFWSVVFLFLYSFQFLKSFEKRSIDM